jgi:hypothetical protein
MDMCIIDCEMHADYLNHYFLYEGWINKIMNQLSMTWLFLMNDQKQLYNKHNTISKINNICT